jgi:uncharacterized protein RhaS with RHS repeats
MLASDPTVGVRYYNPVTGRYISRDPIGYADGLNNYLYVHNNPINRIDPLGLEDTPPAPPKKAEQAPEDRAAMHAYAKAHIGDIPKTSEGLYDQGDLDSMWAGARKQSSGTAASEPEASCPTTGGLNAAQLST